MSETTPTAVHKVTLLVVNTDQLTPQDVGIAFTTAHYSNDCVSPKVVSVETRTVDWSDDHPLNQRGGWRAAYDVLFPSVVPVAGFVPEAAGIAALRWAAMEPKLALISDGKLLPYEKVAPIGRLAVDFLLYYDRRREPDPVADARAAGRTELADLRAIAGALYAKLLQTARKLGQHESTATLELDLAKVHVELGKLGVV